MNRFLLILFLQFFLGSIAVAQIPPDSSGITRPDSLVVRDSTAIRDSLLALQMADSVSRQPPTKSTWQLDPSIPFTVQNVQRQLLQHHPYFGFGKTPSVIHSEIKRFTGKEMLFYILILLLLTYAFVRQSFPKYFNDLFRLFFRTTIKQRQISEQLMQTPLPSLVLNGFFVVTGGLYINFLLQHYRITPVDNFWLLTLYCALGLSVIYFLKFVGLRVSGWVFDMQEAANSYIFVVFVVNKIIGIFLLPFLIMLAFMKGSAYSVALVLSWVGVGGLLLYRLVLTYAAVRNQVKVNPFHFFLYLCAFEIAPLLLIYKALLVLFRQTA